MICGHCSGQSCENVPDIIIDELSPDLDERFDDNEELVLSPCLSRIYQDVSSDDAGSFSPSEDDDEDSDLEEYVSPGPSKRAKKN